MRFPIVVSASVFSIALYFALFWGFDALRILTSPTLGLEDAWRSQIVYWVGRFFGFGPAALLHLAAVFAAIKLMVAGVFLAHIVDRVRCLKGGKVEVEILEFALLGVVVVSILAVMPAVWQHDAGLIRSNTLNLVLASIAAALSIIEREEKRTGQAAEVAADAGALEPAPVKADLPKSGWFSPWR